MLCQKCQQRPATVFFSQTVGNKTTQAHLCEPCAKEQMKAQGLGNPMALNPFAAMANFFNQFMGGADIQEAAPGRAPGPEPLGQCPHCGYQFSAFRQNGRLGCTRCYEAFAPLLEPLLAGLHGNARHTEEAPAQAPPPSPDPLPDVADLREKMKAAIAKEKFEEAARLRDEIQRLRGSSNV